MTQTSVTITDTSLRGWEGCVVRTSNTLTFFTSRAKADRMVDLLKAGKPAAFAAREANR